MFNFLKFIKEQEKRRKLILYTRKLAAKRLLVTLFASVIHSAPNVVAVWQKALDSTAITATNWLSLDIAGQKIVKALKRNGPLMDC
jgi:hypothetical protein